MGYKIERPKEQTTPKPAGAKAVMLALAFLVLLFWGLRQVSMPSFDTCGDCGGRGRVSCGAEGCLHGSARCPASCLKADDPGWQTMEVAGHGPEELWMRFDHPAGGWTAFSKNHVGELVELDGNRWVNRGTCPSCQGSGRVACPVCQGRQQCPRCSGDGLLRRWGFW